jgi:RecA-family ATPase
MTGQEDSTDAEDAAAKLLEERMRSGQWLDEQEIPPLKYVVQDLLPVGSGYLVGPPKARKSFMVAHVGIEVAKGGKVFGVIPVEKRPVLYLALEDGDGRLQVRFRRLGNGAIPKGMNRVIKATPDDVLSMIDMFIKRHPDALVILDTLGKVKPPKRPNQDAYQADYEFGSRLKELADQSDNACLWVVHHTRKMQSSDFVDSLSGTHGLAGAADFMMVLRRERGTVTLLGAGDLEGSVG